MPAQAQITDTQLLTELQNSFIDPNQKKELADMIPEMTAEERNELMAIIKQSHIEAKNAGLANQDKLKALNEEYEGKLNNLVKESTEYALKDFEQSSAKEDVQDLKEFDSQIATMDTGFSQSAKAVSSAKKSHGFRNIVLILLLLLLIAGGVLYTLDYLSDMQV